MHCCALHQRLNTRHTIRVLQRGQHIAASENVELNAGLLQRASSVARPAGEIDVSSRRPPPKHVRPPLLRFAYTSSDEHRQASAAPDALNAAARSPPENSTASMPPASKKFFAKVARATLSAGLPRVARKTFGRAPDCCQDRIRSIAQFLERLREPDTGEGHFRQYWNGLRRRLKNLHRILGKMRKLAGAGERIAGAWPSLFRAPCASLRPVSESIRSRAPLQYRPPSRSPETAPMRCDKLIGQRFDAAGAGGRIGRPSRDWILREGQVACCAPPAARKDRAVPAQM